MVEGVVNKSSWPDFEGRCGEVRDRFAAPLRIFEPPLKSHAPPLGKVSMTDQSENLTFFWLLRVYTSFFCKIETVIAIHLCVKYPFNAMF
jgi:hypothetical protein